MLHLMHSFGSLMQEMDSIIKSANLLENNIDALLEVYAFLKEENELLHAKVVELEANLKVAQEQIQVKEKSYQTLKIAKTIEGSSQSKRDTKLKINALIRTIDKCIVQLNE
ncbi:hypothetical protein KH5_19940 [Urechidicola sp. KH5]